MAQNLPIIPVPVLPDHDYRAQRPPPITTPVPTDQDVLAAYTFKHDVTTVTIELSATDPHVTVQTKAAAIRYENQVASAPSIEGDAPAWLVPVLNQHRRELREIEQRLEYKLETTEQRLKEDFKTFVDDMEQRLTARINESFGIATRAYAIHVQRANGIRIDGINLKEMPFPDGTFPWNKTVTGPDNSVIDLPPLSSLDSVRNLTSPETYGYFCGYYPNQPIPSLVDERKRRILDAIGRAAFDL